MNKLKMLVSVLGFSTMMIGTAQACLELPIPGTIITSNFGYRFHPVFKTWKGHNGTDFRAAMYTPINAAHAGRVTFSGFLGSAGNAMIIMGADGVMTKYFHLSKPGIPAGSNVTAGQQIALSGNSGHASAAPHLHFEARIKGGTQPVDSRTLLCTQPPEKAGAGPDRQSPAGEVAPGATSTTIDDSGTNFQGWEDMSEIEIIQAESERRFLNEDWHIKLAACGNDANQQLISSTTGGSMSCGSYLRRELSEMQALSNYMDYKLLLSREVMMAMLANRMIDARVGMLEDDVRRLKDRANSQASK